ncbi:penicillin acylase family protein [Microbulbifer agarilyticus]|uniref:penicillin acylase family protein n=1 Tax=Microbulbifer agarilyticus TaxID=260552 RepID=UPI001C975003|nr:penicillin acylase family protein [Microbulbifer agarilyticus]MBY6210222.1 penicillin acylase family protein [Microbulbifer agarilyticus]
MPRWLKQLAAAVFILVLAIGTFLTFTLRASLPTLDGEITVSSGLGAPATLARDDKGIAVITAASRLDAAYAMGFAHGQDRFFQMDLASRLASGELAELFGNIAVEADKKYRVHQLRRRADEALAQIPAVDRAILDIYAEGVNAGLASLGSKPFEYHLLRVEPKQWSPTESMLVSMSMFIQMTGKLAQSDYARDLLLRAGGETLLEFIQPQGTQWDTAIDGTKYATPAIPSEATFAINGTSEPSETNELAAVSPEPGPMNGSNSWAISGAKTSHGGALLSNDPHLGMAIPHIWYRVQLNYTNAAGNAVHMNGVSFPGMPAMAIGTNGNVAWSMTNSAGDWADYIVLDHDETHYEAPQGRQAFDRQTETILVKGEEPLTLEIDNTIWGPAVSLEDGQRAAYRWLVHHAEALNPLPFLNLDDAVTAAEAADIAHRSGISPFNFVVADSAGEILWTILGRIPERGSVPSERLVPWQQVDDTWRGWLQPADYPMITSKQLDYIWTANNRIVGDKMRDQIGRGTYALGTRGWLIEQDLIATERFDELRMTEMLQNNRAETVTGWRDHLLNWMEPLQDLSAEEHGALTALTDWTARAAVDDVGYTVAREYQREFTRAMNRALQETLVNNEVISAEHDEVWLFNSNSEGALAKIRDQQPAHWLPEGFDNWLAFQRSVLRSVLSDLVEKHGALAQANWGKHNALQMHHPLASALPAFLGDHLNMPASEQAGDSYMPLAQRPKHGQSMRFVVSPGKEQDGFLIMPGGQSGHPLSDFYTAGHADWVNAENTPLLPGAVIHTLTLSPQ